MVEHTHIPQWLDEETNAFCVCGVMSDIFAYACSKALFWRDESAAEEMSLPRTSSGLIRIVAVKWHSQAGGWGAHSFTALLDEEHAYILQSYCRHQVAKLIVHKKQDFAHWLRVLRRALR